jgi:sortase A
LRRSEIVLLAGLLLAAGAVTGCGSEAESRGAASGKEASLAPAATGTQTPSTPQPARVLEPAFKASDGKPRRAELTIPRIGVRGLVVVPYRGFTDDAPGTEIQNGGRAASPHGPRGGTGPGGIGNYQVTAHRTSSTRAFEFLPDLRAGDLVRVVAGGVEYVYEIVRTRRTSFRSPASLRAQRAAVPGHPGRAPTRAMITLSTCATPEDHAAGNYWADRFGNPEHRIDKIARLVRTRPVRP